MPVNYPCQDSCSLLQSTFFMLNLSSALQRQQMWGDGFQKQHRCCKISIAIFQQGNSGDMLNATV